MEQTQQLLPIVVTIAWNDSDCWREIVWSTFKIYRSSILTAIHKVCIEKVSIQPFCESGWTKSFEMCFIEQGKKKLPLGSIDFTLTQALSSLSTYTHTHFIFKSKLGTIFKPAPSEDQQAKVHALYVFLSVVVCRLTSAWNHVWLFLIQPSAAPPSERGKTCNSWSKYYLKGFLRGLGTTVYLYMYIYY